MIREGMQALYDSLCKKIDELKQRLVFMELKQGVHKRLLWKKRAKKIKNQYEQHVQYQQWMYVDAKKPEIRHQPLHDSYIPLKKSHQWLVTVA